MSTAQSLLDFFDTIYLAERELRANSEKQMRWDIRSFERYLGRDPLLSDLTPSNLNGFIVNRLKTVSAERVKRQRVALLCLWRLAFEHELLNEYPRRVRRVTPPRKMPTAFTLDELRRLIAATDKLTGFCCHDHEMRRGRYRTHGVPRGKFWKAYILTAYDTGLRKGDLFALRPDQLADDGRIVVSVSKNGRDHLCAVRPETLAAIRATFPPERNWVFGKMMEPRTFYLWWHELLRLAGIPQNREHGSHALRRSGATHVEAANPGSARAFLGHLTAGLAERSYIDPRIAHRDIILPPSPFAKGGAA